MDAVERWQQTWSHLGDAPPPGLIDELLGAYSEPHRAYHTVQHLTECFAHLDSSPRGPRDPASVELALWFHDAVYDTKVADNEARSAKWARSSLEPLPPDLGRRIERLILVTQHDAAPETPDEELLLDVDLSILGAPEARFDEYKTQVRREYEWVPQAAYSAARAKILREFAERPRLFHTANFHQQLEVQARSNLERSIAALDA